MGTIKWKKVEETERDLQKKIVDYLNALGAFVWLDRQTTKNPGMGTFRGKYSAKGVADILGVMPNGRFLGIEVKKEEGRISEEQKEWIKKIKEKNGIAFVCRSIEELQKGLLTF